jgi:hypothetical protein
VSPSPLNIQQLPVFTRRRERRRGEEERGEREKKKKRQIAVAPHGRFQEGNYAGQMRRGDREESSTSVWELSRYRLTACH